MNAAVILEFINKLGKRDKCFACQAFNHLFTSLINTIKQ